MSKKAIIAVVAALVLGIGGTVAYFYLHSLYVANTAPPVAATQQGSAVPPAANQGTVPPATQTPVPAAGGGQASAAGTLTDDQLVLAQISYGAAIDAVRQQHGEPYEIDHHHMGLEYEYMNLFDLYVVNGIVQRIKVDDLNGLATSKGIRVGSSVDEVIAAYGQPTLVGGDHYIYRSVSNPAVGFDFEIELNHVENIKCGLLQ